MFSEFEVVTVAKLRLTSRHVDGSDDVKRQPRDGDVATIVHVLGSDQYVLECVDTAGRSVWVADFAGDELRRADDSGV